MGVITDYDDDIARKLLLQNVPRSVLQRRIQELEAEVKRMQPIVDIVALWRAGKTRTHEGKWVEGEMVQAYDDYEASKTK